MGGLAQPEIAKGSWHGRWIWSHVPRVERAGSWTAPALRRPASWACFRRTFDLGAAPPRASGRVTADSRYVLWVNGTELSRGPVRANLRRLRYDEIDLGPALRPGRNVVAALVRFFGSANPWWAPVPAAFELGSGAFVFEARLSATTWLGSDAAWRALEATAWEDGPVGGVGGMPAECHDARRLAPDWAQPDFDDTAWGPAVELRTHSIGGDGRHEPPTHPYGPLLPRPIAPLGATLREGRVVRVATGSSPELREDPFDQVMDDAAVCTAEQTLALPVTVPGSSAGPWVVTLDFGEVVAGTVCLDLEAPEGSRLDAAAVEFLDPGGRPRPDGERSGFRYVARGRADRYETVTPYGLRGLVLSVRAKGPLALRSVSVRERLHPREEGPFFECSDARLNRIWAVGRRTVDLCSHDAYLDCPTREQRAWTGDFVVHQMVDLATHPDWRLARWNVELCASPRPDGMLPMAAAGDIEFGDTTFIPDWALHWIRALHNVYRYTGDRSFVARWLPVAENVLRWFEPYRADDGLLAEVTGWVIVDWSAVTVRGKSSVLNALWARGLADFAEMAEWLGEEGRSRWARRLHADVAHGFELFWDPEREVYVDHAMGRERGRPVSQHALATPIVAGLVPDERVDGLVARMMDEDRLVHAAWSVAHGDARLAPGGASIGGAYLVAGPPEPWWDVERQIVRAQPFYRYVVHDALAASGREDLIAPACLDWAALLDRCPTSWSETWYGGTVSHGWCATPTRDLSTRTLGVTPAEPGFPRARIAPRLGPLDWARGAVPTPAGLLSVAVDAGRVVVESPIPFLLDLGDGVPIACAAGHHALPRSRVPA